MSSLKDYENYLIKRGYSVTVIEKAKQKLATKSRTDLLYNNPNSNDSEHCICTAKKKDFRCFPLVMKYNAKLPKMNKLIKKHLHILEWSPETVELFPKGSIFVSYRVEPSIRDLLCKSGFPLLNKPAAIDEPVPLPEKGGCYKCEDVTCKTCALFLMEGEFAWSYHTNDKFLIKKKLNCKTKYIIYVIFDLICKIAYTGYTTYNCKDRFANHKSHVKMFRTTCEIVNHAIENQNTYHKLRRSNIRDFDEDFKCQFKIMVIEAVDIPDGLNQDETIKIMEAREDYWHAALKTKKIFGGLNKR